PEPQSASGKMHSRNRRGILELAGTIKCSTGRTPLAYLDYGCYCGLGGQGWPRDKVDCAGFTTRRVRHRKLLCRPDIYVRYKFI
uniref:Phospholipase A2 n=1 Tax=Pelusios castaneus TaxID=367368 RepID=A0A8C8R5N7_9SAUR